ncbi:MAG: hypothetical protein ACI9FD_003919 [Gammaproteobacteria bacterium]|jgi:hypothetical protein
MLEIETIYSSNILQIGPPGETQLFTLSEANEVLPAVAYITRLAVSELKPAKQQLQRLLECDPRAVAASQCYEKIVRKWIGKIERLGLVAKGLWWVEFDTGEGYLCWRYPEIRLEYFHDYGEEVESRRPIEEWVHDFQPDWAN